MNLLCLILVYLANHLLRSSANPFQIYHNSCLPFVLVAGLLAISHAFLRHRRPLIELEITEITDNQKEDTTITASNISAIIAPRPLCNAGYTIYSGPGRNFCYRIPFDCRTWDDAQDFCNSEGANLAVFDDNSLAEFSAIVKRDFPPKLFCRSEKAVWIGAKTLNDFSGVQYTDGTQIMRQNPLWALGEPDNAGFCIHIGTWAPKEFIADERCFRESGFVCQHFL